MGDLKPSKPVTFSTFDRAVAYLTCGGWAPSSGDVMTFTRRRAKARIRREGADYRVVYSKKRNR